MELIGGYIGDDISILVGDDNFVINVKLDIEIWLKSLAVRVLGREEVMLSSVEIFFFFIRLIKKNIMVLDFMMFFF